MEELKHEYTIVIVTHNMQQAARTSDRTAFFTTDVHDGGRIGHLVEFDVTEKLFTAPERSPHRGLHHGAVRLSVMSSATSATRAPRCEHDDGRRPSHEADECRGAARPARSPRSTSSVRACVVRRCRRHRGLPQRRRRALPRRAPLRRRGRRRDSTRSSRRALQGERCDRELQLFGPPRAVRAPVRRCRSARRTARSAWPCSSHDVSELHRIESVRRDFVANVSHELKTPIGALEVLAETLVAERRPRGDPPAGRPDREGSRTARPASSTTCSTSASSRRRRHPSREPVPLEVLVDDAVDQLRPAAAAAGINLQVHPGVTGALVACDRRQVVERDREPDRQRGEVLRAGEPGDGEHRAARRRRRGRRCATPGSASRAATSSGSSSASTGSTRRAAAPPAAPGSASPSCATSPTPTAATSRSSRSRGRVRRSASLLPLEPDSAAVPSEPQEIGDADEACRRPGVQE